MIAHKDQVDKAGKPYYLHPQSISEKCKSNLSKSVALLHDTIEDTRIDENFLEGVGIPPTVINRVTLLTKKKGEDYISYVKNISKDPVASEVKYYDLKHNTDLNRTNGKIMVSKEKWENYQKALKLLNDKYHFE